MGDSNTWRVSKSVVFVVVLALHLALLALLLRASRNLSLVSAAEQSVQVIFLPPVQVPRVRAENARPQRLSTDVAMAFAPPALNSSAESGPSSAPDGRGSAVNWAAEAHRAVRAFEIRRDAPPSPAQSVSSPWDSWWPQHRAHHAGDRYKTESGDWIVWIDANCYQVASWHAGATVANTSPPQTICPAENDAGHADSAARPEANAKPQARE